MNRNIASSLCRYAGSIAAARASSRSVLSSSASAPVRRLATEGGAVKATATAAGRAQAPAAPAPLMRNTLTALALLGWVGGVYYYTIFRMQGQVISQIIIVVTI